MKGIWAVQIIASILILGTLVTSLTILPAESTFPGENGKIVFTRATQPGVNDIVDIITINPDGSEVTNLTNRPIVDNNPRWSADGLKICFSSEQDSNNLQIYFMNSDGTGITRVTNSGSQDIECSWSPDGTKIVFERSFGSNDIFVINVDGTGEMNLSNDPSTNDRLPDWSPDGSKIAWMKNDFGNAEIYVMNPDGSNQQNISNLPGQDSLPEWSPDGQEILFRRASNLWIMNADGTNKHEFGGSPFPVNLATWSPDGQKIAFSDAQERLFVVNVDGTGLIEITDIPGTISGPHWQAVPPNALIFSLQNFIQSPTPTVDEEFGWVSISGNNLLVGANRKDVSGLSHVGEAYLFNTITGTLIRTIPHPSPASSDQFGINAISGSTAVISAPQRSSNAGIAYVFDVNTGNLQHTLQHPTPTSGDQFGWDVSISGNNIAVGAVFDDVSGNSNAGSAHAFDATTGNLIRSFTDPNIAPANHFGTSVFVSGNQVLIGADGNANAGATYLFDISSGNLLQTFTEPALTPNDLFGHDVVMSGNFIAISAPRHVISGQSGTGQVYIFNSNTGNLLQTLSDPNPIQNNLFGWSLAISGNRLLVGTINEDAQEQNVPGNAYLFDVISGNILHTFTEPQTSRDRFGWRVATSSSIVAIGATFDSSLVTISGGVYLFKEDTGDTGDTGGGGGGSDQQWKTKPTFGVNHQTHVQQVEGGFTVNYKSFDITDNWHTNLGKQTILVDQINTFAAKAYSGPGLQLVKFMFGIPEVGKSYEAETSIEVWLDRNLEVTEIVVEQKDNLINEETIFAVAEKANCTDSDTNNRCDIVLVSVSFNEAPLYDIFALEGMDIARRNQITYLNEGIHVEGNSLNPSKIVMFASGEKGGLTLLVQIDKRHDIWVDGSGIKYQKNQFGTFVRISPVQFERFDDPASNVMTRLHSDFDLIKQYELNRASKMFDSSLIQKDISESFSFIMPEKLNKLDDPEVQAKMLQEDLRAREKLIELWNSWYSLTKQSSD